MRSGILLVGVVVAGLVAIIGFKMSAFVVTERDQAVVLRLSKPVHIVVGDRSAEDFERIKGEVIQTANKNVEGGAQISVSMGAGLYFKMPFVDTVEFIPDVMMTYDAEPEAIVLADKKTLVVDNFARWRVENPLLYRISVGSEVKAKGVLDDTIYSVLREELGQRNLIEVIRTTNDHMEPLEKEEAPENVALPVAMRERIEIGREKVMQAVTKRADDTARSRYGIQVVDVRIKRADLLPENFQAVFGRMMAERLSISKGYRSDGHKEAQIIRAETDRKVQVMLAEAERDAATTKGEGEAAALQIFAEAFQSNPDLYTYMRSLEVLQEGTPTGSELYINADSGLFSILKQDVKTGQ
jgi:membrane protease subunit HflC